MTTVRLWARTQRVSDATTFPPVIDSVRCLFDEREIAEWTPPPPASIGDGPYVALGSSLMCDEPTLPDVTS